MVFVFRESGGCTEAYVTPYPQTIGQRSRATIVQFSRQRLTPEHQTISLHHVGRISIVIRTLRSIASDSSASKITDLPFAVTS
jgi:hypothetical protein